MRIWAHTTVLCSQKTTCNLYRGRRPNDEQKYVDLNNGQSKCHSMCVCPSPSPNIPLNELLLRIVFGFVVAVLYLLCIAHQQWWKGIRAAADRDTREVERQSEQ